MKCTEELARESRLGVQWSTSTLVIYAWGLLGIAGEGHGWARMAVRAERIITGVIIGLKLAQLFGAYMPSAISNHIGVLSLTIVIFSLVADMLKMYNQSSMSAKSKVPCKHLKAHCVPHQSHGQHAHADNAILRVKCTDELARESRLGVQWSIRALFPLCRMTLART